MEKLRNPQELTSKALDRDLDKIDEFIMSRRLLANYLIFKTKNDAASKRALKRIPTFILEGRDEEIEDGLYSNISNVTPVLTQLIDKTNQEIRAYTTLVQRKMLNKAIKLNEDFKFENETTPPSFDSTTYESFSPNKNEDADLEKLLKIKIDKERYLFPKVSQLISLKRSEDEDMPNFSSH
jgi:hypothetical protein